MLKCNGEAVRGRIQGEAQEGARVLFLTARAYGFTSHVEYNVLRRRVILARARRVAFVEQS